MGVSTAPPRSAQIGVGVTRSPLHQCGAFVLVEYLIYITVLAVVMGIAFGSFYQCLDSSRDVSRQTEMILRTVQAGELWRADIRQATNAPRTAPEGAREFFEIPTTNGLVVYLFDAGAVWRRAPDGSVRELLTRGKGSSMHPDQRIKVASWQWDLELLTRKKTVRVRPLFTFEAVPTP
jgi:hypothetical protein